MARLVFVPQLCISQPHEVLITHFHEDSGRTRIINTHANSKGILISSRNLSLLTYEGRLVCLTGCFIGGVARLITFSGELFLMSHQPRNKNFYHLLHGLVATQTERKRKHSLPPVCLLFPPPMDQVFNREHKVSERNVTFNLICTLAATEGGECERSAGGLPAILP